MSVLHPRNRSVYFRISEVEFQALENLCQEGHARSISELSREAVSVYLRGLREPLPGKVDDRLHTFERMIAELQGRLLELQTLVQIQTVKSKAIPTNGDAARIE